MYQSIYADTISDTQEDARLLEGRAFAHALRLLEQAASRGPSSRESVEALAFLARLWGMLMEDLATDGNGYPAELRASLISIGIWVLRRAEDIRQGRSAEFDPLIAVMKSLAAGLARQ